MQRAHGRTKKNSITNLNKRHEEHFVRWFEGKVSSIFNFFIPCDGRMMYLLTGICFQTVFADHQTIRER